MRTVVVNNRSRIVKELLKQAREDDVLIQTAEGEEFLLSVIDDFAHEIAQQRKNKKLMAFLDERFRQARREKGIPLEQVKRELGLDKDD